MEILLICVVLLIAYLLPQRFSPKSLQRLRKSATSSCVQLFSRAEKPRVTPFLDVFPAAVNYKCCAYNGYRKCNMPVSQKDRSRANSLCGGLSICPPTHPSFESMLERYVRACLCTRTHRKHEPTLSATVNTWSDQLRNHFDGISIQHTEILLSMPGALDISPPTDILTLRLGPSTSCSGSMEHAERHYKASFDARPDGVELDDFPVSDAEAPPSSGKASENTPWSFQPYNRAEERTLEDVIWSPLGIEDREPGHIYAFTRKHDESHIKIGYTKVSVTSRMAGWSKSCKYEPIVLRGSQLKVPNAKRIETLIHIDLELRSLRRREAWCRRNENCRRSHGEWFEISISQAKAAIEYWISWMQTHTPYRENGQLDERCIVAMHSPSSLHESGIAPRFTSDSSGRPWFGARGERGTSDVLSTKLQVPGGGKTESKDRRRSSEPGIAYAFPSSQNFPSSPRRTERFYESKSDPSLPLSAMLDPTEGHVAIDTPSTPSLARESDQSPPSSAPLSGGSLAAEMEKPPESRQIPHETLGEDVAADPSRLAPSTGDYLVGSRQSPIPIDSDTDEPQSPSRRTRPSPTPPGSANTLHVKHEAANAVGPTLALRIPGQDRRWRRRSAPSTSTRDSSSDASQAKPRPQTPAFDVPKEWACSQCTYKNAILSPECEICRHAAPGFAAVENVDLPPLNHGPFGRKRRPQILEQMPASDPVVPLARDLGDEGVDEMLRRARRMKAKARRRSDRDFRTRRGRESS